MNTLKRMAAIGMTLAALMAFAGWPGPARATVVPAAELTQTGAGNPDTYSITLHNNSTAGETFSTFWFAWIPGQNYMDVSPTNVVAPSGWTFSITHNGSTDGYAIHFVPNTPMAAGTTVSGFTFQSTDTLTTLRGNSQFYSNPPVTTSQVFSSSNTTFVVTVNDAFTGSSLGSGWYSSAWFGTYNTTYYPWINDSNLGFIYVSTSDNTNLYLYVINGNSGSMGWLYTTQAQFPNVYSFTEGAWLYYTGGTSFYNYTSRATETY